MIIIEWREEIHHHACVCVMCEESVSAKAQHIDVYRISRAIAMLLLVWYNTFY